jgi:hypothetical protein
VAHGIKISSLAGRKKKVQLVQLAILLPRGPFFFQKASTPYIANSQSTQWRG